MSIFLDLRLQPVGGGLAASVTAAQATGTADYQTLLPGQLEAAVAGRDVLLASHGFNVNRADGIYSLSRWEPLLQLSGNAVFIGILWPGDSIWAHGLDYPEEPRVANEAGQMLGPFIDQALAGAASISFASHSLGARVVLETISAMALPVRRLIVMAGAIDDNCLNKEFQQTAARVGRISVLSSKKDKVLADIFPLGNLVAGIIAEGHPWWHAALGHAGPSNPRPANFQPPFMLPKEWDFGHGDYLGVYTPPHAAIPTPTNVPPPGTPAPGAPGSGWQEAWTASLAATRFE